MNDTDLYTSDGRFVDTVRTPPWVKPPELLIWGQRFFILQSNGNYEEANGSFFVVPPIQPADGAG